eukprot:scaffold229_cov141-Skeletonema_marinoi.AAC.3
MFSTEARPIECTASRLHTFCTQLTNKCCCSMEIIYAAFRLATGTPANNHYIFVAAAQASCISAAP